MTGFDLIDQPGMVRMLLQRLVDEVPGPRHRVALHACATARVLPESMLAAALGLDVGHPDQAAQAHALFEWLGGLSCIETSPHGLSPHDLAREVLYADARRCDFAVRRTLNGRLLGYLYERFQRAEGAQRQRLWFDIIYVQRNNPGLRPYFAWSAAGTTLAEPLRGSDDIEAIRAMTLRHEGEASAAIAAHWLRRQPDAFLAFRDLHGRLVGYLANLRLEVATDEDRRIDPATDRALAFVEKRAPARAGEEIGYFRFWMAWDDHQSNPATMNVLAANASLNWTTHPRLAWSLCAVVDPDHFEPMFRAISMQREPDADFALGSRRWGVFAHDWRAETVAQWLMRKVDRASQDEPTIAPVPGAAPLLVLSEPDFADAVRRALRDFACPDALAANPLLQTRVLAAAHAVRRAGTSRSRPCAGCCARRPPRSLRPRTGNRSRRSGTPTSSRRPRRSRPPKRWAFRSTPTATSSPEAPSASCDGSGRANWTRPERGRGDPGRWAPDGGTVRFSAALRHRSGHPRLVRRAGAPADWSHGAAILDADRHGSPP